MSEQNRDCLGVGWCLEIKERNYKKAEGNFESGR